MSLDNGHYSLSLSSDEAETLVTWLQAVLYVWSTSDEDYADRKLRIWQGCCSIVEVSLHQATCDALRVMQAGGTPAGLFRRRLKFDFTKSQFEAISEHVTGATRDPDGWNSAAPAFRRMCKAVIDEKSKVLDARIAALRRN